MPYLGRINFDSLQEQEIIHFSPSSNETFRWTLPWLDLHEEGKKQIIVSERTLALFVHFAHMLNFEHSHGLTSPDTSEKKIRNINHCPCYSAGYRFFLSHLDVPDVRNEYPPLKACGTNYGESCHTSYLCQNSGAKYFRSQLLCSLNSAFKLVVSISEEPCIVLKRHFFDWFSSYPEEGTLFDDRCFASCLYLEPSFFCALFLFTHNFFECRNPLRQPLFWTEKNKGQELQTEKVPDDVWKMIVSHCTLLPFVDFQSERNLGILDLVMHPALVLKNVLTDISEDESIMRLFLMCKKGRNDVFKNKRRLFPMLSKEEKAFCVEGVLRVFLSNGRKRLENLFKKLSLVCKDLYRIMRTSFIYKPLHLLKMKMGKMVKAVDISVYGKKDLFTPESSYYVLPEEDTNSPCLLSIQVDNAPKNNGFNIEKCANEGFNEEKELLGAEYMKHLNKKRKEMLEGINEQLTPLKNKIRALKYRKEHIKKGLRKLDIKLDTSYELLRDHEAEEYSREGDILTSQYGRLLDDLEAVKVSIKETRDRIFKFEKERTFAMKIGRKLIKSRGWKVRITPPKKLLFKRETDEVERGNTKRNKS